MNLMKITLGVALAATLSACAAAPIAVSHQQVTSDGRHWAVQMTMSTGVAGSPVQTVMLVYNQYSKEPRAIVSGNSLRLSDQLFQAVLNLGPSIVAGEYHLAAERINCPAGTLCGTLVQVQNTAGATADADSESNGS